mmetsp:Transcript_38285/g.101621  ORF Transcript_38285/g.101621 Transcript_38285/m.101621 type:complete len:548 (-) Transcript_38285:34-1677(-)
MCALFKDLGKFYLSSDGLGPMNFQIYRAQFKKAGGDLSSRIDKDVSIVCIKKDASSSCLDEILKKCSPNKAACVDIEWIKECVSANRLVKPLLLRGCLPDSLSSVFDVKAFATSGDSVQTDTSTSKRRSIGDQDTPPAKRAAVLQKDSAVFPTGWTHDSTNYVLRWVSNDFIPLPKVAAFDLDSTLIVTKSGRVFPKDAADWRLLRDSDLRKRLRELAAEGHALVVISNQGGIRKGKLTAEDFRRKISAIQAALELPLAVFAAYGDNLFRKPAPQLWAQLRAEFASAGVIVSQEESLYVGDAAGRGPGRKDWSETVKKDHSDSDRKFALNAGIAFHCPESFFLGQVPQAFALSGIDPADLLAKTATDEGLLPTDKSPEMVLLVGWPGSGKTSLAQRVFVPAGYLWVNRDTLRDTARCHREAESALLKGRSVVVDATNPSVAGRADYVTIAKRAGGVPVRCLLMAADRALADHLNQVRQILVSSRQVSSDGKHDGKEQHGAVPPIAMATYGSKFEMPTISEGFSEVRSVGFCPVWDSDFHREIFSWRL